LWRDLNTIQLLLRMGNRVEDRVLSQQEIVSDRGEDRVETIAPSPIASSDFPRQLESMRVERGLTKADLAKRTGFDPSTITRFEQGSRGPDRDAILVLSNAMVLPLIDRDRLLAAAGFRSVLWDDPLLIELAQALIDPGTPREIRDDIRSVVRAAISHSRISRIGH
jgi:transcriptional regulator with XRE-family HTH domain